MATFRMTELFKQLGVPGPDLLLRECGRQVFPLLADELSTVSPGHALTLDFSGVQVMDTSFCDETVLELAIRLVEGKHGDRFLVLSEPTSATIDNIEGAIGRRRAKIALIVRERGGERLVGRAYGDPIEPNLVEAWEYLRRERSLTARALADDLNLEINTASMRLHKLYTLRLAAREEEVSAAGRQHNYSIPN